MSNLIMFYYVFFVWFYLFKFCHTTFKTDLTKIMAKYLFIRNSCYAMFSLFNEDISDYYL